MLVVLCSRRFIILFWAIIISQWAFGICTQSYEIMMMQNLTFELVIQIMSARRVVRFKNRRGPRYTMIKTMVSCAYTTASKNGFGFRWQTKTTVEKFHSGRAILTKRSHGVLTRQMIHRSIPILSTWSNFPNSPTSPSIARCSAREIAQSLPPSICILCAHTVEKKNRI